MHTTTAQAVAPDPQILGSSRPGAQQLPTPRPAHVLWATAAFVGSLGGAAIGGIAMRLLLHSATAVVIGVLVGGAVAGFGLLRLGLLGRMGWTVRDLGFQRARRSLLHLLWFVPVSIVAALTATAVLGSALAVAPQRSTTPSQILEAGPLLGVPLLLIMVVMLPLLEEIVFRRVLLDWLISRMPVAAAAVIVVIVFAAVHMMPAVMLYIVFFGIPLVIARLWFGTLWAPLILHAINNALVTLIGFLALL